MDELILAIQEAANTIASPNWADIKSVHLSIMAILASFVVAVIQCIILIKQTSISNNQNRIALFEKRIEIFNILSSCSSSIQFLKPTDKYEEILRRMVAYLNNDFTPLQEFDKKREMLYLAKCALTLRNAAFLFPKEIASFIVDVAFGLTELATADTVKNKPEKYNEKIQNYFEAVKVFNDKDILTKIRKRMKIN